VKYEPLEQTTSCWVGQDKYRRYNMEESWQEAQSDPRTRPGWTYLRGASRNSHSSMYKEYKNVTRIKEKTGMLCVTCAINCSCWISHCSCLTTIPLMIDTLFSCLIVYFLCRLNIKKHDSHEFILEFSTVANRKNEQ
jgi:hypothetical protein